MRGTLVQKKKTIYPEWGSCFDSHLKEGRVIQVSSYFHCHTFVYFTSVAKY